MYRERGRRGGCKLAAGGRGLRRAGTYMVLTHQIMIEGVLESVDAEGSIVKAVNPATEEVIREYLEHTEADIRRALDKAVGAFEQWREKSYAERGGCMRAAAGVLRGKSTEFAELMTVEMGKPITGAEAEVEKCAAACEFFADRAGEMLKPRPMASDATRSFVRFDPLGSILAVMPWNFPFWQLFRFAAPSLMAGNVAILKHATNVPGCALAIEEVFREAGFPDGVMTALLIQNEAAEGMIGDAAIRAVTLTGSPRAGRAVAGAAAKVLKKCVLELGGSDPFIVLRDADISSTARAAAEARCINSGQSCIAAKRFIVERAVAEEFEGAFAEAMASLRMGDPMRRDTQVGPLARKDLRENLHEQVQRSVKAGARVLTGGTLPGGRGYFYPPTVLADVRAGMAVFDEETFGPVAAVVRAGDADEAIDLANRSDYGLGGSIWTKNLAQGGGDGGED